MATIKEAMMNGELRSSKAKTEIKILMSNQLTSNLPYQRKINNNKVKVAVENFDERLVELVKVSYRDGKYNIMDGQHTVSICEIYYKTNACPIKCIVYYGLSEKDEARLYKMWNKPKHKTKTTEAENWKADRIYDKDVQKIIRTVESTGLTVGIENRSRRGNINALLPLKAMYEKLGEKKMYKALMLLVDTFGVKSDTAYQARMLNGMTEFMSMYGNHVNSKTFVKKISKLIPQTIYLEANTPKARKIKGNEATRVAYIIYSHYNKKLVNNVLENKFMLNY